MPSGMAVPYRGQVTGTHESRIPYDYTISGLKMKGLVKDIMEKNKEQENRPNKKEVERISDHYRTMVMDMEEKEAIHMSNEDFDNLIDVARYAEFGRSTAIQAAYCLGHKSGKNMQTMSRNDILDTVFTATCKLELMQTVLGTLINMTGDRNVSTPESAMRFASNQNVINDFLHIALDGVHYAIQTLDDLQKGGVK